MDPTATITKVPADSSNPEGMIPNHTKPRNMILEIFLTIFVVILIAGVTCGGNIVLAIAGILPPMNIYTFWGIEITLFSGIYIYWRYRAKALVNQEYDRTKE